MFRDLNQDRIYRWSEEKGLRIFRENTGAGNGNAFDAEGRLITCEGGARRVTRLEKDGTLTVLAEGFDGELFNSPNDIAVGKDGSIYFTDPNYNHPSGVDRQFLYLIRPDGRVEKALPHSFNIAVYENNRRKPDEQGINVCSPTGRYKGQRIGETTLTTPEP